MTFLHGKYLQWENNNFNLTMGSYLFTCTSEWNSPPTFVLSIKRKHRIWDFKKYLQITEDEIFQESTKYEHSTSTLVRTCDGGLR